MQSLFILDSGSFSLKYNSSLRQHKKYTLAELREHKYTYPFNRGTSFHDKFTSACEHALHEEFTGDGDDDVTLLVLLDTLTPPREKEAVLYASFERFRAKKVSLVYSAATTLYSAGETSGSCVDVGFSGVRISTVYNSVTYPTLCSAWSCVGGRCADEALQYYHHGHPCNDEMLEAIKKQQCFLGEASGSTGDITLPDGATFTSKLTAEEAKGAAETMLFSKTANIPRALCSLMESASVQFGFPQRYALAGHGANLKGISAVFSDTLSHGMFPTLPKNVYLKNPHWAAVEGGTILSQLGTFKTMCISGNEYEEEGPARCVYGKIVDPR